MPSAAARQQSQLRGTVDGAPVAAQHGPAEAAGTPVTPPQLTVKREMITQREASAANRSARAYQVTFPPH